MADGGKILSLGRMSGSNLGKMSINFGSQKSLPLRNSNYAKSRLYWRRSVRAAKIYKSQNFTKIARRNSCSGNPIKKQGGASDVREE